MENSVSPTNMKVFPNKRIVFKDDIIEPADGDHPEFIMASKGQGGTVIKKSDFFYDTWLVEPDGMNAFYAKETEFKDL
jgi:hypothetical protein